MDLSLQGKRALVGGASRGIGRATAIELASQGAEVCCIARNEDGLQSLIGQLDTSAGQSHDYICGDANDPIVLAAKIEQKTKARAFSMGTVN